VATPVRCSWQGIDRSLDSLVTPARAVKIYNFIITIFDCQGGSKGGGISVRAFALARHSVAPPLGLLHFSLPEHRRHPNKQPPSYSESSVLLLKLPNTTTFTPNLKILHSDWLKILERIEYKVREHPLRRSPREGKG